jgi:DNA-directed RNA polymerase subunit E'/Rpb7
MIQIIKQKVSIDAMYLDKNFKYHILVKLKKTMEGRCTFDNGYIITVNKIINVGSNTIGSANSLIIFDITYEANTLRPEKGVLLTGKVCMVFKHGIFVDICGKMKVLVPSNFIKGYEYQQDSNSFTFLKSIIKNDVEVSVDIVDMKYDKKQFSCIGKLNSTLIL